MLSPAKFPKELKSFVSGAAQSGERGLGQRPACRDSELSQGSRWNFGRCGLRHSGMTYPSAPPDEAFRETYASRVSRNGQGFQPQIQVTQSK